MEREKRKRKTMKVRMRANHVMGGMIAKGYKSPKEAVKKMGCDERTLRRAINGLPVQQNTARKICKAFDLDPESTIIYDQQMDAHSVHEKEVGIDDSSVTPVELEPGPIVLGVGYLGEVCVAAGSAIESTFLSRQDRYSHLELIEVLSLLIAGYATEVAKKDRETALFFIEDIAHKAKMRLDSPLLELFDAYRPISHPT